MLRSRIDGMILDCSVAAGKGALLRSRPKLDNRRYDAVRPYAEDREATAPRRAQSVCAHRPSVLMLRGEANDHKTIDFKRVSARGGRKSQAEMC